jgi:hypothetical protein
MIKFENRFDEYAYRIAYREIDSSISTIEEGTWVTVVDGKVVVSDGTKRSFLCITSKRSGRDQLSGKAVTKAGYLLGNFELTVTNFDATKTYGDMEPLVVNATGQLRPYVAATDKSYLIVAYALGTPVSGALRICSN